MKTDLTLEIEQALRTFDCETLSGFKLNHKRDSIRVSEVTVANSNTRSGIVDFMRLEEHTVEIDKINLCWLNWRADGAHCELKIPKGSRRKKCDQTSCKFNKTEPVEEHHMLITAMEIKVTLNDFKSKNGHNFIGNVNYYVIPDCLLTDIKDLVAEDIGIITYGNKQLIEVKQSKYVELILKDKLEYTWSILKATRKNRNTGINNQCRKLRRY